ncbi:hypothetical protein ACHAW6_012930 [Cyclotella cf. meneghiniana]
MDGGGGICESLDTAMDGGGGMAVEHVDRDGNDNVHRKELHGEKYYLQELHTLTARGNDNNTEGDFDLHNEDGSEDGLYRR